MNTVNFSTQSTYAETHKTNQAYLQNGNSLSDDTYNTPTKNGDTVSISEEAYHALMADTRQSTPEVNNNIDGLNFSTIKTFDTDDGTKIEISYAIDKENNTVAMVNFSYNDGTIQNMILKETSVISKNNDMWARKHQDISNAEQIEYARLNIQDYNGKRTEYLYKDEISVNGGDSDDIIIILPATSENGTIFTVNTGEGNNFVIDLSGGISKIKSGSGNDSIVGYSSADVHGATYTVDSGAGDDVIEITGESASISSGDGNDTISVNTMVSHNINAGSGNDTINADIEVAAHSIIGGKGNDKINIFGDINLVDIYGGEIDDHDDNNDVISISGGLYKGNVYTGNGKNNITIGSAFDTKIISGSGNDTIKIGTMYNSYLDTGDGDDNISIRFAHGGKIISGPGSNIVDILNAFGSEIYSAKVEKKQKDTSNNKNSPASPELSEYDKQIAEAAIGGDSAASNTEKTLPEEHD